LLAEQGPGGQPRLFGEGALRLKATVNQVGGDPGEAPDALRPGVEQGPGVRTVVRTNGPCSWAE